MKQILIYVSLMILGLSSSAQTDAEKLVGTWRLDSFATTDIYFTAEDSVIVKELMELVYIKFNIDGSFNLPELDEDNPSSVLTGTYHLDKNTIVTIVDEDDVEIIAYLFIKNNYLKLSMDNEIMYFRKDE